MSKIKELQLSSDIRGIAIGTEEFDATLTVEESFNCECFREMVTETVSV